MTNTILTVAQMNEADRRAIKGGTEGIALMRNAGQACVSAILERFAKVETLVLCGPGNNGGDGFIIAKGLEEEGWPVSVACLVSPGDLEGDARLAYEEWILAAKTPVLAAFGAELARKADLIVDAVFGTGLARDVVSPVADIIRVAQERDLPVVAVDCPSGVRGDDGQIAGTAFEARLTITFHRKKPAHLLFPGRGLCGEIVVADIGIEDVADEGADIIHENDPALWLDAFPWPALDTHKYRRGHTLVTSGGVSATGAARLAAVSALRVGSGLVSVASPASAVLVHASHLTSVMIQGFNDFESFSDLVEDPRLNAFVIGPGNGVGERTRQRVLHLLATRRSIVLDADALTSFEEDKEVLFAALHDKAVLTPHGGEFRRLFVDLADKPKLEAAREAAKRVGATIVLKGPDTVIAGADGQVAINANAPATLATAGSGDVLAGLIGGLLAQGMDAFAAACAGVWMHGEAADLFGPGLISEDLPGLIPEVLDLLVDQVREQGASAQRGHNE
jgi:NAD(P)H-hydrate epimerase